MYKARWKQVNTIYREKQRALSVPAFAFSRLGLSTRNMNKTSFEARAQYHAANISVPMSAFTLAMHMRALNERIRWILLVIQRKARAEESIGFFDYLHPLCLSACVWEGRNYWGKASPSSYTAIDWNSRVYRSYDRSCNLRGSELEYKKIDGTRTPRIILLIQWFFYCKFQQLAWPKLIFSSCEFARLVQLIFRNQWVWR